MNNFQHATKSEVLDSTSLESSSATGVASPETEEFDNISLDADALNNSMLNDSMLGADTTDRPASNTFTFNHGNLEQYEFDADDFDMDALDEDDVAIGASDSVSGSTLDDEVSGDVSDDIYDADLSDMPLTDADILEGEMPGDNDVIDDETFDTIGEVMEVEVIDSEEQDRSYEVYQEGSLTYFRYYLDDEEDGGFYEPDGPVSPRPFLSAGAMGVGVLAATFGVGLLVAEGTNRRAQEATKGTVADASTQQQPIGSKRIKTEAKGDPASPESLKPVWSAADKAIGKSITAKSSNSGLLAASKPEDKVSLAAAKLAGGGTAIAAASSAAPSSTWNSSAAATPYVPPAMAVTPIVTPNYEVVSASALPAVPLPKLSAVPTQSLSSYSAITEEQRRLTQRMEALRNANNPDYTSAQTALQTVPTLNTSTTTPAAWRPDGDARTYVTDAIRSDSAALVTPVDGAYSSYTAPSNEASSVLPEPSTVGLENEDVAIAPTQPNLLEAPPNSQSEAARQRAELQKQLMNQAIAQPVTGLLVVPVSTTPGAPEVTPLSNFDGTTLVEPGVTESGVTESGVTESGVTESGTILESSIELEPIPVDVNEADPLLEAQVPAGTLMSRAIPTAQDITAMNVEQVSVQFEEENIVESLQELLTLAQKPQVLLQPLTMTAAQEVLQSTQELEQFRVLRLASADYNQLWRMTARSSERLLAPAHGFVDYQRNVIAVMEGNALNAALERDGVRQLAQALTPAAGELGQN